MRLYIAEKPSMGREIAKCLQGPMRKGNGFVETGEGIVTWVFGHILRQAEPQEYDDKYKSWRAEDLPIVPQKWKLLVAENCKEQFEIIKGLIAKADEIVHAGDPDREGQLLVDEVLEYVGNTKPVRRILLNALDEKSIKDANSHLRNNSDFVNLKKSALARARADWLIGMNLSRAFTLAGRRAGRRDVFPVGRVKTPTLALVVRREREIQNFKPVDYYGIKAEFKHKNGNFFAVWKPKDTIDGLDSEGRLIDKKIAEEMLKRFLEAPNEGIVSGYTKAKKQELQKLPLSLSSLQVLAGKRFGYSPQLVLDTAQSLYEKKLTTYPRSDCEYLPQNQYNDRSSIINNLKNFGDESISSWATKADLSIKSRAWNDKKISAHHAIIPTRVPAKSTSMNQTEKNIYFLVAQSYLTQFYPVHTYNQTKVELTYKDELFTASGRVILEMGWKELYGIGKSKTNKDEEGDKEDEEESITLPTMKKGDSVELINGNITSKVTKPPIRFTSSTLLAAMKEIHKFVKDPEAKKKLKDVYGIGTEATRATIIEDLIKRKFLLASGKKQTLSPNESAYTLIDAIPDELSYPDFTAIWEDNLHSMADGDGSLEKFLEEQVDFTRLLCSKASNMSLLENSNVDNELLCPRCRRGIMQKRHGKNGDFWGCGNFPKCKATFNDKEGKPDFEGKKYIGQSISYGNLVKQVYQDSRATAPTEEDYSVLNDYNPYAIYANNSFGGFNNKPKVSAMPMEKLARENKIAIQGDDKYLCPKCKTGHLKSVEGRNGRFWSCDNYPRCTASFDDMNNEPRLDKN